MSDAFSHPFGIATFDTLGPSNPWVQAFGELVYAFSQLERCSFQLLDRFAPSHLHEFGFALAFKQRTQFASAITVAALLQSHPHLAKRGQQALSRAVELAEIRNKILHNLCLSK
ncbi:MAG: hypothetical protein IPM99_14115 [Rubrivivax sp.]|nr:hypothetical protein [Rubrivivax sp.]